ncbi:hypothetical protein B0T18DRAFT_438802 [Schizothecium vesticola]|uniref:Rhodopsin domain-containing protein n=1 Tax=Schizothecium vesticola TaxID=314040 RepID=A0AA40EX20_9PEZI|nr:hypothetical protein B0T18DRAFT_438802 [Schizothecium vesticola]
MRLPPPEVVASWPPPNYINPETRGMALIAIEMIILPIALLVLALRLYVRVVLLQKPGWDDWLMLLAAIFGTGVTISVLLASTLFGWSLHIYDLPLSVLPPSRQVSLAAQSLFILATSLAKLSILLSYLRFAPLRSPFRRATYAVAALLVAANAAFLVLLFTQCTPLASYWTLEEGGHCVPEGPPLLAQAASTVFFDAAVWVLPLGTLARARLPARERVAVVGLFGAGAVVVAAAAVRTYWVWWVVEGTWDVTWEGFELWIWTAVEVHLGVICGEDGEVE